MQKEPVLTCEAGQPCGCSVLPPRERPCEGGAGWRRLPGGRGGSACADDTRPELPTCTAALGPSLPRPRAGRSSGGARPHGQAGPATGGGERQASRLAARPSTPARARGCPRAPPRLLGRVAWAEVLHRLPLLQAQAGGPALTRAFRASLTLPKWRCWSTWGGGRHRPDRPKMAALIPRAGQPPLP